MDNGTLIGSVLESSAQFISVKVDDIKIFEKVKSELQIGKYLKIQNGNHNFILSVIQNIKISIGKDDEDILILTVQPVGVFKGEKFYQGNSTLPSPTEPVFLVEENILNKIFNNGNDMFKLGKLAQNEEIEFFLDGNKFFSKHVAVVGSTGSGKSCAVARLLQNVVGIDNAQNINKIDPHAEKNSAPSEG